MKKYVSLFSRPSRGFTLIELLITMAVVTILTAVGINSYMDYSQNQTLNNSALDVAAVFSQARSRAQSQVKPAGCSATSLSGYKVTVTNGTCTGSTSCYQLFAVCGGADVAVGAIKYLNKDVSVTTGAASYTYLTQTGQLVNASPTGTTITFSGFNRTKSLSVYSDGRVHGN